MRYFLLLASILLVACNQTAFMNVDEFRLVKVENVSTADQDSSFRTEFPEVINPLNLQIVKDTILVIQDQISDATETHFKAYSLNDYRYLGSFLHNGRGPEDVVSPYVVKSLIDDVTLNLVDGATGEAYKVDVSGFITKSKGAKIQKYNLPNNIVDWVPLDKTTHFVQLCERDEFVFQVLDSNKGLLDKLNIFHDIDINNATYLSLQMAKRVGYSQVAMVMCFFPQLSIYNVNDGTSMAVAVNKDFRDWKSIMARRLSPSATQYYSSITTSSDYIYAVYRDIPIGRLCESGIGSSIHVFDWDGNFKYDIKVKESIGQMTYDEKNSCLYCIELSEGRIIRYDMTSLFAVNNSM